MNKTGISWTDTTWNPVRGCSRVSAGCQHCYAEIVAARFSGKGQPYEGVAVQKKGSKWTGKVRVIGERLADPLRLKTPHKIFVNSMSDLFHENLRDEDIATVVGVMTLAAQHTYQVLTKRAKRMHDFFAKWTLEMCIEAMARSESGHLIPGGRPWNRPPKKEWLAVESFPVPWIWLGVSTENQETADERIPLLLNTPAAVRFISAEPLIGELDLDLPRCNGIHCGPDQGWCFTDDGTPWCSECEEERSYGHWLHCDGGIDWVIAGCESGSKARPCNVEWLRKLREQCDDASVPFFLKQATANDESLVQIGSVSMTTVDAGVGSKRKARGIIELPYLDGVQHAAFPSVTSCA
jgi:protein gp37